MQAQTQDCWLYIRKSEFTLFLIYTLLTKKTPTILFFTFQWWSLFFCAPFQDVQLQEGSTMDTIYIFSFLGERKVPSHFEFLGLNQVLALQLVHGWWSCVLIPSLFFCPLSRRETQILFPEWLYFLWIPSK